ncbi:radical SAM protein [Pyrobaculum aerophilum]|mgnify:CR=1 FL=1|uniref:Metallo cofactor biosynthesis protein n=2 Tax=Pyrobaculum aerophilum TaxID=13773 RepID=Q8ZYU5_PYRAE|nr:MULTISPECIES: radical SAM protein [Pyrobaculum]AAL62898.1 metallo cofactor biosynthesis protein [Pyrobaculum aerophilum str. IM2]MCX8135904.1 radical SAM protein [Pyrobaculum aerophilum]HII46033.1 radical SAM protein [Pyrobaculum aerophilum]
MRGRLVYNIGGEIPQVGTLAFGIVDRGTNVIEVRPTSICALNCIFCSVNAGPLSRVRWAEYVVEPEPLLSALEEVVRYKKTDDVEVHIDGMGDPGHYPHLAQLVRGAKSIKGVALVSMQTRLYMLDKEAVQQLANAGLDRFNVSVDALDPALAKKLAGAEWYDVEKALELIKIALEAGINVIISPVWVPGLNDGEMPKIVKWAAENGVGRGQTPVLIQKYIPHKRGRKVEVRPMTWGEFWRKLREMEKELGIPLIPKKGEYNIHKAPELPKPYAVGDTITVEIVARGIFKGEMLGVAVNKRGSAIWDRVVTVAYGDAASDELVGKRARVRVIENAHNIYIARPLRV